MPAHTRQNDPDWPVDFPFVAIQDFNPPPGWDFIIRLKTGDQGRVSSDENNGNICVQLPNRPDGCAGQIGWVPRTFIRIGTRRAIRDGVVFDIPEPPAPRLSGQVYYDNNDSLTATVSGLLSAYHHHRDDFPINPPYIEKVLEDSTKIRALTQKFVVGVGKLSGDLSKLLKTGECNIGQVADIGTSAANMEKRGLYIILYSDFKDDRKPQVYIGSTSRSFKLRDNQHKHNQKSVNARHYQVARQARKRIFAPICYFDPVESDGQDLKVAEQVLVSLFQSFSDRVLSFQPENFTGQYTTTAAGENSQDGGIERISRYFNDKAMNSALTRLADQVFNATGWPTGVRRGGLAKFGAAGGLNWQSPLAELSWPRSVWTKIGIRNSIATFRRTEFTARSQISGSKTRNLVVFTKTHKLKSQWAMMLTDKEPQPPEGAKLHIVVDINLDGRVSAAPLSRSPQVGPFSDWREAHGVSMRIEWQDKSGQWLYRYCQMRGTDERVGKAPDRGGLQGYDIGSSLRAYLL